MAFLGAYLFIDEVREIGKLLP